MHTRLLDSKINNDPKHITTTISIGGMTCAACVARVEKTLMAIEGVKIKVRPIYDSDIASRKLPENTKGVLISQIDGDSPINYLNVGNIIIEADGKKIKTPGDLKNIVNTPLKSSDKTFEIVIYNNQNQKRSIGVKLD